MNSIQRSLLYDTMVSLMLKERINFNYQTKKLFFWIWYFFCKYNQSKFKNRYNNYDLCKINVIWTINKSMSISFLFSDFLHYIWVFNHINLIQKLLNLISFHQLNLRKLKINSFYKILGAMKKWKKLYDQNKTIVFRFILVVPNKNNNKNQNLKKNEMNTNEIILEMWKSHASIWTKGCHWSLQ